jgi:probable rRNA maturation factor
MNPRPRGTLTLHNRQRLRSVDKLLLRRIITAALREVDRCKTFDLGVYLVGAVEMQGLNETYLRHKGSTDVITFDYNDPAQPARLCGEVFVCIHEAVRQAGRFRTAWQSEVVRYVVHGILHLSAYDDRRLTDRRRMKREEDRLVRHVSRQFDWASSGGSFALSQRLVAPKVTP